MTAGIWPHPKGRLIRRIVGTLGFIASVVFVAISDSSRTALQNLAPRSAGALVLLQIVYLWLDSYRYFEALPPAARRVVPFFEWGGLFAQGRLMNMLVPQSGTAYRALVLRKSWNLPVSTFVGSLVVVTWLGNAILLMVASGAIFAIGGVDPRLSAGLMAAGAGVLVFILVVPRFLRSVNVAWVGPVKMVLGAIEGAGIPSGRRSIVVGLTLGIQMVGIMIYWVVLSVLGTNGPLLTSLVLYSASTIATFVSLTPNGLGILEGAAALAALTVPISSAEAVLVVLLVRTGAIIGIGLSTIAPRLRGWR